MRAVNDCFALHQLAQLLGDLFLSLGIEAGGSFVKKEDLSIFFEKAPCDEDSLLLATGEHTSEVTNLGQVAAFRFHYFIVDFAGFADFNDFFHSGIGVAIL